MKGHTMEVARGQRREERRGVQRECLRVVVTHSWRLREGLVGEGREPALHLRPGDLEAVA